MEKKGKVLPSDNNSPDRTDYPRETEPGENKKKERFCLQITTAKTELTTQEKQNQVKRKKERFCLQITTAKTELTTQERQNQVKRKKERFCFQITTAHIRMTKSGKKLKNEGSSLKEISQVTKD